MGDVEVRHGVLAASGRLGVEPTGGEVVVHEPGGVGQLVETVGDGDQQLCGAVHRALTAR